MTGAFLGGSTILALYLVIVFLGYIAENMRRW